LTRFGEVVERGIIHVEKAVLQVDNTKNACM
jgi:hypothetical protein